MTQRYPDLDYSQLNPGMRHIVAMLRHHGFVTTDSGDGFTNAASGMEGTMDVPHVVCVVKPTQMIGEADRLRAVMAELIKDPAPGTIQASYDPSDGSAVLLLLGVDDSALSGGLLEFARTLMGEL